MALKFTAKSTDKVNLGTSTAIMPDTVSICAWIYPTSVATGYQALFERSASGGAEFRGIYVNDVAAGQVQGYIKRAGASNCRVRKDGLLVLNTWQFICVQLNTSGVDANQKIFHGKLGEKIIEQSGYTAQGVGAGATSLNAGIDCNIGNNFASNGFPGAVHFIGTWSRILTLDEITYISKQTAQNKITVSQGNQLFMYLGNDTARQFDYSPNANHGTVTGATPITSLLQKPKKKFYLFSPPATNNYTQSLSGALSPSANIAKIATRPLSGSVASSGTIRKAVLRTLSGAISSTGVLVKSTTRRLLGGITPSGNTAKAVSRRLTASIASSGSITALRVFLLNLASSIGLSGVARKAATRNLTGSIIPQAAIGKSISRFLSGLITSAGNVLGIILGSTEKGDCNCEIFSSTELKVATGSANNLQTEIFSGTKLKTRVFTR